VNSSEKPSPNPSAIPSASSLLIGEIFRRNAEVVPTRIVASLGDESFSHAALNEAGNRLAHALHERGIGRGDRVVSWADTSLVVLPLFVALSKLGAVFAPLNARLGAREASEVAALARASLLVVDESRADAALEVAKAAAIPQVAQYRTHAQGFGISCEGQLLDGPPDEFAEPSRYGAVVPRSSPILQNGCCRTS
jgi:acyl-CoA synthetase (AMP-forming)/AMP-acid ligase II